MADLAPWVALWGAVVSTVLAAVRLWEFQNQKRITLDSTYVFRGHPDLDDEIVIANLSLLPVLVSGWKLEWRPKWFGSRAQVIDVTPDFQDELSCFTVSGHSRHTLTFSNEDKISFGSRVSQGRKLILELSCFGRVHPVRLRIDR